VSEALTIPTSASALTGMRVVDETGAACGRVKEFAVDVAKDGSRVAGLILQQRSGGKMRQTMLAVEDVALPGAADSVLRTKSKPESAPSVEDFLLLDRDLLDQQIIDVDGRKVVRVNDVNLAWEPGVGKGGAVRGLVITDVEVGTRGASRRLLKGLPQAAVEGLATKFKARIIPWEYVDLIDRDPSRRVKLKVGQDRLAKLHPSDIAELLEELAPAEREAVFSSLPEETAAEALEEFEPKMQKELVQRMDSERAADIIEEMDPGAAADLLGELTEEESDAILEEMEPEERHEVEELLEFAQDSAAGLMTTDYVSVAEAATVGDAVEALRSFEGDADTISEVYLLGAEKKFAGVVTLPSLLLADAGVKLAKLASGHNVSCRMHDGEKEVTTLFDKYNLRSLPVVDSHGRIAGVIHAEQVIAQLVDD
jgi:magnesium transporter